MAHAHSHRAAKHTDEQVAPGARASQVLLGFLGACLAATIACIVVWWPASDAVDRAVESAGPAGRFAAPGVAFVEGEVVAVREPCAEGAMPDPEAEEPCGTIAVTVGADTKGIVFDVQAAPDVLESGLEPGDSVELMSTPVPEGAEAPDGGDVVYSYFGTNRDGTLALLAIAFVVVVVAIARLRGVFALVGLAFGGAVVWWFMLPALFDGAPGVGLALVGSSAIMYVVLYATHGFSWRTSTALAGTLIGIALTALIGVWAIGDAHLTGISDESAAILASFDLSLDFRGLLGCALVIAGLGVLNDVTITQASAVWELRASSPTASRTELFRRAMRIGRDHIASTIYTIVFAYVGTALVVLLLLRVYDRPLLELLSTVQLAEEIVRTLATSIGLVLAVPVTTAIAAVVASPVAATDEP